MNDLLDINAIPDAPKLEPVGILPAPITIKPKRKSYYVPVAERHQEKLNAKKQQKEAKKAEAALRDGQDVPVVPNARKRAADRKASKTVAKASKAVATLGKKISKSLNKAAASLKTSKAKAEATNGSSSGSGICSLCHKPLSRHSSVSAGMGDTCAGKIKLLPAGTTMEDHYAKITVTEIPDGYIKLKDAVAKLKEKGISGYRLMQAIGGERMLRKPLNSNFKTVMFGNTRYINGACLKSWRDLEKV